MADESKTTDNSQDTATESRRKFLKKSAFAVYATPAITTLLVSQESAAESCVGPQEGVCVYTNNGGNNPTIQSGCQTQAECSTTNLPKNTNFTWTAGGTAP